MKFLLKYVLFLLLGFIPSFSIGADNVIVPQGEGVSYIQDNLGNLIPLGITYTTDGNGNLLTLNGLTVGSDNLIVPKNLGKAYLMDNSNRLFPASVIYTTDGSGNVIPISSGGGGGGASWGSITGTLSSQTDLQTALNGKLAVASNLSDLASASTARTNLGLGSAAVASTATLTGAGITVTGGSSSVLGSGVSLSLPQTQDLWVWRFGTDSSTCGQITHPCNTVGYALTLVTSPSQTNNWTIHLMSGRNDAETGDLLFPPYVWLVGSGGPDVGSYLRLPSGNAIKLGTGWTDNGRGGIQSVYLGGGTSVDLDFVSAGGSAGSNFMLDDVFVTGTFTHTGRGVNGGDFLYIQNTFIFGNASMTGSELQSINSTWGGTLTAATGSTVPCDLTFLGGQVSGAFSFTESSAQEASMTSSGTTYVGGFTTTGTIALTIDSNLPPGFSLSGGTTRTNLTDANSFSYTPGTSANWATPPTSVGGALDNLIVTQQSAIGSQPACSSSNRGLQWLIQSTAGVADIFQICQQTVSGFAWVTH